MCGLARLLAGRRMAGNQEPYGQCRKLAALCFPPGCEPINFSLNVSKRRCADNVQHRQGVTPILVRQAQNRSTETGRRIRTVHANVALR